MPGGMDGHMLAVWTQEHYPDISNPEHDTVGMTGMGIYKG